MNHIAPPRIHVLAKPTGAICNLACSYCFFLDKELLYPGSPFRMSDKVLENYIRQLIEAQAGLDLYYIEQLYTFGNRYRTAKEIKGGPRTLSVAYVALTREDHTVVTQKAPPGMKVFDNDGKLLTLVECEDFDAMCVNMDLAIDTENRIYVIDTVRLNIHAFAPGPMETAADRLESPTTQGATTP